MQNKEIEKVVEEMIISKYDNDTLRNINSYIHKRVEDIERQLKFEKLKEDYDLVEEDLNKLEEGYTRYDIVDMIEMSYMLCGREEMQTFNYLLDICFDGINLYGLFVKFCYDKYYETKSLDMGWFLNNNLEECLDLFIQKYFKEV